MVRLGAESKSMLVKAAELRGISVSDYVRTVTMPQTLRDCYEAGQTFAFVGVVLDCVSDKAKSFYRQWDFMELPGNPYRLVLSAKALAAMMEKPEQAS